MSRHACAYLLIGLFVLGGLGCDRGKELPPATDSAPRLVSLAPAITETLFAIGAGPDVVAVSQYCDRPAEAKQRPSVGSALTPNFEALVRLNPSLIITETNQSTQGERLRALGPTLELPWLTLPEIATSTRELGRRTGHAAEAERLAQRLELELGVSAPADGPRVLLVLGYTPGRALTEVWFIRHNSLHGAALAAAGGRNAVEKPVNGLPRLSLTELLRLDPDQVIVLVAQGGASAPSQAAILKSWNAIEPLRAVQLGRVSVLEAPEAFGNGPSILELKRKLQASIAALKHQPHVPSALPSAQAGAPLQAASAEPGAP